jgi:hypothetical protein
VGSEPESLTSKRRRIPFARSIETEAVHFKEFVMRRLIWTLGAAVLFAWPTCVSAAVVVNCGSTLPAIAPADGSAVALAFSAVDTDPAPPPDPGYYTIMGPDWSWTAGGPPGAVIDISPASGSATVTVTMTGVSTPGHYVLTVTATATYNTGQKQVQRSGSTNADVWLVGVDRIQFQVGAAPFQDLPSPFYVPLDSSVTFKALKTPADAPSWPAGYPVWSGSSGATGTGEMITVTFGVLSTTNVDFKTVNATCGNTVTGNVVVYDFDGVLTPVDDFEGRSYDRYGICETINLSYTTTPPFITEYDIGGLQWEIVMGGGELFGGAGGVGTYVCSDEAGQFVLRLVISGGPFVAQKEKEKAKDKDAPTLARMEQVGTGVFHRKGRVSAGFKANTYYEPVDVSFSGIVTKEGTCKPTEASGPFAVLKDEVHKETASWVTVNAPGGDGKGSKESGDDEIMVNVEAKNLKDGSKFIWNIPWYYIKKGDQLKPDGSPKPATDGKKFLDVQHLCVCDAAGTTTISKPALNPAAKRVEKTKMLMEEDSDY